MQIACLFVSGTVFSSSISKGANEEDATANDKNFLNIINYDIQHYFN